MSKTRLFLSSTVRDLLEYRDFVSRALRADAHFEVVCMGGFDPDLDENAWRNSLAQIARCQAFLGVVGARYGTIPEGEQRSITHMEFDEAFRLKKSNGLRIAVLIADPETTNVTAANIEPDAVRDRHKRWVASLSDQIEPRYFTREDFTSEFVKALRRLHPREYDPRPAGMDEFSLFGPEDVDHVLSEHDPNGMRRENRISRVIETVARQFEPLFLVTDEFRNQSPFFTRMRENLEPFVFDVEYDPAKSSLLRAGIRHVLVRSKTLLAILHKFSPDQLKATGTEVGLGAAADFCSHFLVSGRIPNSLEALIEALNKWDQTGGWGRIAVSKPLEQTGDEKVIHVTVRNHFLVVEDDIDATHKLCGFWEGYLRGFLMHALLHFDRERDFRNAANLRAQLPYLEIPSSVEHLEDNDIREDTFRIVFRPRPDADIRAHFRAAIQSLDSGNAIVAKKLIRTSAKEMTEFAPTMTTRISEILAPMDDSPANLESTRQCMKSFAIECDRQLEERVRAGKL